MTNQPFTSFLPVLTMLGACRKGETERQYGRRFMAMQDRYLKLLSLRYRLHDAAAARQAKEKPTPPS